MKRVVGISFLFILANLFSAIAQEKTDTSSGTDEILSRAFQISGQLGLYGELYTIHGKDNRRPPATGRIFFQPTITLFNNFSIYFDIFISTEGSQARQQLSTLSLHPGWSWGKAHLGTFNHQFTPLTLSGETITGGGLELFPGIFRLEIVGGRTRRKVNNGIYNSTYTRHLYGVKLGLITGEGSSTNINIVKAKDDISSLPKITTAGVDSDSTELQYRITPKENLVLSMNTNFNFLKLFNFSGEIAGSVLSNNLNSSVIESDDIPKFVNNLFKIRTSTNVDFAYQAGFKFNYDIVNVGVFYSVINPGYQSLGITSNINDERTIKAEAGISLLEKKLTLRGNYQIQNNNLLNQKLFTLVRTSFGISTTYQPINTVSLSINMSRNIMKNDTELETNKIENLVSLYSINTLWQLDVLNMKHSLSVSYSHQKSEDLNILRKDYSSISKNINMGITTLFNNNWTLSPMVSINIFEVPNRTYQATQTYSMMAMIRMLESKLSNSFTLSYMNSSDINSVMFTLQSSYNISKYDVVQFTLRTSMYFGKLENVHDFKEHRGTINFVHRF
ncbi:MAG: hypothetical protein A2000_05475 [Ignavibacteria bacterium GWB2_36_8]|nr:MAG: hypothetical protein A2000_05475 [Ignavibacteria bacterium GWB2_36_8]OGU49827.1 MAG: hypothetical protein A2080_04210 [Ignavibacteria bacterium GWC2_36_12]